MLERARRAAPRGTQPPRLAHSLHDDADTRSECKSVLRVIGGLHAARKAQDALRLESLWVPAAAGVGTQEGGRPPVAISVALSGRDFLQQATPTNDLGMGDAWVSGDAAWVLEGASGALALYQLVCIDGEWRLTARVSIDTEHQDGRRAVPVPAALAPAVDVMREFERTLDSRQSAHFTRFFAPTEWVFAAVVTIPKDRHHGAAVSALAALGTQAASAQQQLLWQLPSGAYRRLVGVWSHGSVVWAATQVRVGRRYVTVVYQVVLVPRAGWRIATLVYALHSPVAEATLKSELSLGVRRLSRLASSHWLLEPANMAFVIGMLVYALTRLWRLGEYPIYFFTDEAVQVRHAEELLRRGLRGTDGIVLPMYFQNANTWGPFFPVYLHAVALSLLGKSVEIARGTAALVTLTSAGALGMALRLGLKTPTWWTAPLILATAPGWFLHSRTAFETVFAASFYAWFIFCYVLYRTRSPRFLYPAVLFLALTFYSYSNAQTVAAASGLVLGLLDANYHLRHWRHAARGAAFAMLLALPLLAFQRAHPATLEEQLTRVGSYWYQPLPAAEKLRLFGLEYARGLSPQRWFLPDPPELARHRLLGYGQFRTWLLPAFVAGVAVCAVRIRSPGHRVLLVALLAAPLGGALSQTSITRAMAFVTPAAALVSIGLGPLAALLRPRIARVATGSVVCFVLAVSAVQLLHDSLTHGPLWFRDYGLYGQQWGAKQLFDIVGEYLAAGPNTRLVLTSNWANGTDEFRAFFMDLRSPEAQRVTMGSVRGYMVARLPLDRDTILIMMPEELTLARESGRFSQIEIDWTLSYPDGSPGFHFVRLAYAEDFDRYLEADREVKRTLTDVQTVIDGEHVAVRHSIMDGGSLSGLFDGNPRTLARFNATNPAVLEVRFARPRPVGAVRLLVSAGSWHVVARLQEPDAPDFGPTLEASRHSPSQDQVIDLQVADGPPVVATVRFEIRLVDAGDEAIIHLRDLVFR